VKRYVAVAGTIGAGKTSLVAWLVKRYGLVPYYEPNDENPYLEDRPGSIAMISGQSSASTPRSSITPPTWST
jgi:hypothetical protein